MAKKAYIGVSGVARKIKKGYIGVNGVARRIKKAYIGVGGVARPCWSGGELTFYGPLHVGLSEGGRSITATQTSTHAIFAGGVRDSSTYGSTVDFIDASLTRSASGTVYSGLSVGRYSHAASHTGSSKKYGDYAVFAGGKASGAVTNVVDAYNTALTRTNPDGLTVARRYLAATCCMGGVLFAGGYTQSNAYPQSTVDHYDTSMTKGVPSGLAVARSQLAATTVGIYALFGGGFATSYSEQVDWYNVTSLTRSVGTSFTYGRSRHMAVTVGNYALFAGGQNTQETSDNLLTIEVYDQSLTHTTPIRLSQTTYDGAATRVGSYAIIGGGYGRTSKTLVDAYDESLTHIVITELDPVSNYIIEGGSAAATVGDYAIFAGGDGLLTDGRIFTVV